VVLWEKLEYYRKDGCVFCVDYITLHQIIQQYLYTGVFRAKIASNRYKMDEGYIELEVKDGIVLNCYFITTQGQIYKWVHWETQLAPLGVLNWEQTSQPLIESLLKNSGDGFYRNTQGSVPSLPAIQQPLPEAPCHISTVSASQQRGWPMLHRQVYSLIDGKRQIPDIAQILRKTPQEIARVIDDLKHFGFIKIR
jgi:hypothetical protein